MWLLCAIHILQFVFGRFTAIKVFDHTDLKVVNLSQHIQYPLFLINLSISFRGRLLFIYLCNIVKKMWDIEHSNFFQSKADVILTFLSRNWACHKLGWRISYNFKEHTTICCDKKVFVIVPEAYHVHNYIKVWNLKCLSFLKLWYENALSILI